MTSHVVAVAGSAAAPPLVSGEPGPIAPVVRAAIMAAGVGWAATADPTWIRVTSQARPMRQQGWKLHLSATVTSARDVLAAALPVLLAEGCQFKVAATLDVLAQLNDGQAARQGSGKFLTAYPTDDAALVRLAARLHAATDGLDGPAILSDRRYSPTSLVHVRYGVFSGQPVLNADGEISSMLADPSGRPVRDRREPRYTPPAWASCPLGPEPQRSAGQVLLDGRFVVREAIRHANKGGVFVAVDQTTGDDVVVKQARAHVGGRPGRPGDAVDGLRHEAAVLSRIEPWGHTPRLLSVFEQGGDTFLAEARVPGTGLRSWVATAPTLALRFEAARRIVRIVTDLHSGGAVLRDLTPNNLIVGDDLGVKLVDLELAVLVGDKDLFRGAGTLGYAAPEQLDGGCEPSTTLDLWSLGAVLAFLFTGEDPFVDPRSAAGDSASERLRAWLSRSPRCHLTPPGVGGLIHRLTADDPTQRLLAESAGPLLEAASRQGWTDETSPSSRVMLTAAEAAPPPDGRLAHDLLRGVTDSLGRGGRDRLTPSTAFGETTDPRNVQHGVAGVLGVLMQAFDATGDETLRDPIQRAASWLVGAVDRLPGGPVGLHFGAAGIGWALTEAGRALEDPDLGRTAADLLLSLPADWAGPDLTHGQAGLGLTLLHTGGLLDDSRLLDRAHEVAEHLCRSVTRDEAGVSWRTPADAPSSFAGQRFYGMAHGTAGIGLFLLELGRASRRMDLLDLAAEAADCLISAAVWQDGTASWGSGPDRPLPTMPHWCNGASGVGTFLVRAHTVRPDARIPDLLRGTALAVMATKWQSGTAYCHGLAGNADYLLDLHDHLGDGEYRVWADNLAGVIGTRALRSDDRLALADEPARAVPDFNVGEAGALSFLLRLQHGGPRAWLPTTDEYLQGRGTHRRLSEEG